MHLNPTWTHRQHKTQRKTSRRWIDDIWEWTGMTIVECNWTAEDGVAWRAVTSSSTHPPIFSNDEGLRHKYVALSASHPLTQWAHLMPWEPQFALRNCNKKVCNADPPSAPHVKHETSILPIGLNYFMGTGSSPAKMIVQQLRDWKFLDGEICSRLLMFFLSKFMRKTSILSIWTPFWGS